MGAERARVGPQVEPVLTLRPCFKCRTDTYEASLVCSACKLQSPACVVSGYASLRCGTRVPCGACVFRVCCAPRVDLRARRRYPIPVAQMVQCKACDSRAIKAHWNAFVSKAKACPWCKAAQGVVA